MAQMATGTANRSAVSTSNNSWAGRFSDFGGVASSTNKENNAPSGNASASQKFGGNGTWASGIWGSSALGNRFTSGNQNSTRPRDEKAFPSSHATTGSEGKSGSGSLVASSESDTWNNRPWGAVDATSPSYPTQIKSAATSPVRHRNSNQNPPPQSLGVRGRDTSPYFTVRQAAIGQGVLDKSPNKSYLNPTSLTFIANQGDDENGGGSGFPTLIGGNDSQSRNINSTFGFFDENEAMAQSEQQHDLGYLDRRASAVSSRTSSLPGSRHDPTSGLGVQYQSQDTSAFSQFPKTASSLSSHRAHRSGNSSSISSQSNGIKYDDVTNGAKDAEAMLGNMKLVDGTRGGFYGQVPSGTVGLNDSHYGHNELQQSQWNPDVNRFSNGSGSFPPSGYTDAPFADQIPSFRPSRVGDRDSLLPSSTDYRRSLNSPHYSTGGTPPAAANRLRTPPYGMHQGQGPTDAHTAALDRKLRGLQQEQQGYMHPTHPMMNAQFRGQYGYPYDYGHHGPMSLNPLAPYFPMPGMGPIPPNSLAPRGPSRELDVGQNLRSALLEEFRSNSKTSKRYELKDIYNHIVEFSGDQHGSRFIQQKLETANSDEKDQVFREIQPNSIQLMTDVFGNYVIQKFFEHGNQAQKKILANQMKGNVLSLSLQMYGCRVVQKALEHILTDQQASLVKELEAHVLKCVKDQNGNHVIQKAIERVPSEHIEFINQAFKGQIQSLATHPYGCRVIQRMLEHSDSTAQVSILQELHSCAASLIIDQYGNYVSQHVIEHGGPEDKSRIIKIVTAQIVHFSKHKFASNVVEKSIQFGSDDQRREILATLTVMNSKGEIPLQALMRDQFGNYVIQKLLAQLKGADRERLVDQIKQQLPQIKKYSYGKQINAIEKLIYTSSSPSQSTTPPPSSEVDRSAAPTPPLTAGAQSPQTSSLPSTNTSTVEEPIHQDSPNKTDEAENGGAVRVAAVES